MTREDLKIRIFRNSGDNKVKAGVAVTIGDMFVVKGIKIVEGPKGLFVAMPSKPKKTKAGVQVNEDGKTVYLDIFHPITVEGRQLLEQAILDEYKKA